MCRNLFFKLNLRTATEALLVANTPSFLFKRLREDPAVHLLAERYDAQELLNHLRSKGNAAPGSVAELVQIYACLVALALKDPGEVGLGLRRLTLRGVRWAETIKARIEAYPASSYMVIQVPARPSVVTAGTPRSTSSASATSLSPSPKG